MVIFKTIHKPVYLRSDRITSSVLVTKIRKSPDISKPNGITNARHDEVGFCSPLFAFFAHIGAFTRRFSSGVNFVWHVLTLKLQFLFTYHWNPWQYFHFRMNQPPSRKISINAAEIIKLNEVIIFPRSWRAHRYGSNWLDKATCWIRQYFPLFHKLLTFLSPKSRKWFLDVS